MSPWRRLATTCTPSPGWGLAAMSIGGWSVSEKVARGPSASRAPDQVIAMAGAWTTPAVGLPSSTRAMLTVNSPLREMNSRVPSSGSTSQKRPPETSGMWPAETASSETTGISGVSFSSAARIRASAASSASVTGELSSF